jgi:small subunit ribosomal protein S1
MPTQIELIDRYRKELSKLRVKVDDALLKGVVKALGPAVYRDDASKISAADAVELERVKQNFLVKRLGLPDSAKLDAMLNKALDRMGRSNKNKSRAVLYYILTQDAKREAALL